MTRNIFIWLILTYICYQECKAFNPSKIDLISFNNNKQQLLKNLYKRGGLDNSKNLKAKKRTPSMESKNTDKSVTPLSSLSSYNKIIENLRKDWQMPSIYLEKRGYFNKVPKSLSSRIRDETNPIQEEVIIPKKSKSCCNSACTNAGCKPCRKTKKSQYHPKNKVKKQLDDINVDPSNEGPNTESTPAAAEVLPTTKAPGFFQKVKNVFSHKKNNTALVGFDSVEDLPIDPGKDRGKTDCTQKLVEFRYDDSWLYDPGDDENEISNPAYPSLHQKRAKNWPPLVGQETNRKGSQQQRHTLDQNIFTKNLNYDEVFKNLTQVDVDYVKNFLKCYKENKSKFLVDYLHVNITPSPETKTPGTEKNPKAVTTAKPNGIIMTTTLKPGSTSNPTTVKNVATTGATKNATVVKDNKPQNISIVTQIEPPGNNTGKNNSINVPKTLGNTGGSGTDIKLDLDIEGNETGEGDGDSKNCTAIRLSGLSFDLEVGGVPSSTPEPKNPLIMSRYERSWHGIDTDNDWNENDIISQYLSDSNKGIHSNSFLIQPPYSDNFLDQVDEVDGDSHEQDINKGNSFLTKFTKKREVARSEDEVLSDISSSLDKFSSFNEAPFNYDEYYDDSDKDSTADEKKSRENVDDYPDDNVYDDENAEIIGRLRKKMKKKKKKKNKKLRLRNNIEPTNLDVTLNDPAYRSEQQQKIAFEKDAVPVPENSDWVFTDLSDIKFRVNPEQEEEIQKFIESLNSPPEIFSFDVDKYIRQPENKLIEESHIETPPQRTFYEFIDTPSLGSEQVPFIQPEKLSEKETRSSENRLMDRSNNKRDLLKQYIKGVSYRLNQIDHPMYELEEEGANAMKGNEKREDDSLPRRETFVLNNYENNLDATNYKKFKSNNDEYDDFVDKFYLLNDGTIQIYEPKPIPKSSYDPESLAIDLDLDKKFRELKILENYHSKDGVEVPNEVEVTKEVKLNQQNDIALKPENSNLLDNNNENLFNNEVDSSSYTKQDTLKRKAEQKEVEEFEKHLI